MIIAEDSTVALSTTGSVGTLYVAGSLGGGTATVGYMPSTGFQALKDSDGADMTLSVGEQYMLQHGQGARLYVQLSGSTDASLEIQLLSLN